MRSVSVNASIDYDVWVGTSLLSRVGEMISAVCGGEAALLVADDSVHELYGHEVKRSLEGAGYTVTNFVFPHGEQSKSINTYLAILDRLAKANLTRSDLVVALGGGVTGDVAGFAAATYLRGISFVQIPTTLLAMVDSSVGGKTAVDLPTGKNQVGAFYQPRIVLCDVDTLKTLPADAFVDGCAEMIKHGIILSAELFACLKQPLQAQMEDLVAGNIAIKRDIVAADERDVGIRQVLNFGHTVGHGIEMHSGYSVTHGRAVAAGIAIESRGAFRLGLCAEDCYREIIDMLERFGLPVETTYSADQLADAAFYDKKRSGQSISLALPERIGACVMRQFDMDELRAFIRLGLGA